MATDFGQDLDLAADMAATGRLVSGTRLVGQAVFRRLSTPRGMVIDAPNYGLDLRSLLSRAARPSYVKAIPHLVQQEVLKDERVASCRVVVVEATSARITLQVFCETADGPFRLGISADQFRTKLLELSP